MEEVEQEVWDALYRHLQSIFDRDAATYQETTAKELSLYEWFIVPHRQDGLPLHLFMIEHGWANAGGDYRYDLWEPRLQLYGNTAIVSYTFMLTMVRGEVIEHQSHNESRVLVKEGDDWKVVHVHKSPAWKAPLDPP